VKNMSPMDLSSVDTADILGKAQALQPSLPAAKTTQKSAAPNTTTAMIKAVGGLGNWYKLFPAKAGKWTQVMLAQIRVVEANQVPKPLHTKPAEPFNLQGSFQVIFGTGAKSGVTYAFVTRKDPRLGTLSAWYARDVDIARVIGSGLKKINTASADYAMAAAQDMAVQAAINQAKANLQGGAAAPAVDIAPSAGLSVPAKVGKDKRFSMINKNLINFHEIPRDAMRTPSLPLTEPLPSDAPGLVDDFMAEGGATVTTGETPLWKNPLVIGGVVLALAGGVWFLYKK
jgi:hypothetical protein